MIKVKIAKMVYIITSLAFLIFIVLGCVDREQKIKLKGEDDIKNLVYNHAKAWETGNLELLDSILHEEIVFAYPGRRMNKQETLKDFIDYNKSFKDTRIYFNKIIVDGGDLAVE